MSRVSRILLNAVTVLSIVLCLGAAVLWVRSYHVSDVYLTDTVELRPDDALRRRLRSWKSNRGLIVYRRHTMGVQDPNRRSTREFVTIRAHSNDGLFGRSETTWNRAGFSYAWDFPTDGTLVVFPWWAAVCGLMLLPTGRLITGRRRRRARNPRRCPACGYDLRATPDRCPECGATPTKPAAQQPGTAPPP